MLLTGPHKYPGEADRNAKCLVLKDVSRGIHEGPSVTGHEFFSINVLLGRNTRVEYPGVACIATHDYKNVAGRNTLISMYECKEHMNYSLLWKQTSDISVLRENHTNIRVLWEGTHE